MHIESATMSEATFMADGEQLQLKHYREGMSHLSGGNLDALKLFHTDTGATYDLITDPSETQSSIEGYVNAIGISEVEAGEGVNECDINKYFCPSGNYPAIESAAQPTLFTAMRALSSSIMVLGPSNTTQAAASAVGNLSASLDYGVMHDYPSWYPIENPGYGNTYACGKYGTDSYAICWAKYVSGGKPIISTESGWGDYGSPDASINGGDSEGDVPSAVKADYVGRLYAFHWLEGVPRTYYFQFVDDTAASGFSAHGLYDVNGVAKPAALEVANLYSILADPNGSAFTPKDTVGINGPTPAGAYTVLLQKANGSEYMLYWTGCTEYEGDNHVALTCPTTTVTATISHVPSAITNWALNLRGGGEETKTVITPALSIPLTFKPQLQILQLGS